MKAKYFVIFLISFIVFYCIIYSFDNLHETVAVKKKVSYEKKVDSTVTVTFSAVGDIMCHSTQYHYAWVEKDSFDFNNVFSVVGDYLREKDILIGNLETVLSGKTKRYSGYPFFNTPNALAFALKNAGFDFLTTANNHANDQGLNGVRRTLAVLKKVNIMPLGTKTDSTTNYNYFVRKGLRFGLLAYTYGTNYNENALNPRKYVNYIDTTKIKNDINALREKDTDIIIIYYHFGTEYQKDYSQYQNNIVNKTISYGADIILGAHPHTIQPFVKFKTENGNLDSGFVAYSLGNFISNQRWRYSDGGIILNFNVTKNIFTDSVYISDVNYLPIWVFKGNAEKGKEYIILPSQFYEENHTYDFMSDTDLDIMKKSFFDSIDLFTKYSNYPSIDTLNNFN